MQEKAKKKALTPSVLQSHERFPDEALRPFLRRAVDFGRRALLPEVRKPTPWLMERARRPLSVQGLPGNPLGE